jgi:hypothetical protein
MVADAMPQQLRKHRRRSGLAGAATLVAWCLAGALDGPLAAQNREHQQMAAELRILQEQQQQLAQTLAQVIEALKAIPTRIDDATAAMRKGFADQELRISALTNDVSSIRERTQDSDTRLRSLRDEVDALRATLTALQTQITQLAQAPAPSLDPLDLSSTAPPPSNAPPTPSAAPIATTGLSPSRMLDSAKSDYFASQFTLALSGFEAILRTFPRTESAAKRSSTSARPIPHSNAGTTPSPRTPWWCRTTPVPATSPRPITSAGEPTRTWGRRMPPGRRGSS